MSISISIIMGHMIRYRRDAIYAVQPLAFSLLRNIHCLGYNEQTSSICANV